MIVDHIGYAVKDIEKARTVFEELGYSFRTIIHDTDRNLLIQFGENDQTVVELLQTFDSEKPSPIVNVIKKNGPTAYHICYISEDLEHDIGELHKKKWVTVSPPSRAIAFGKEKNVRVAFLLHRQIGLIELVENYY